MLNSAYWSQDVDKGCWLVLSSPCSIVDSLLADCGISHHFYRCCCHLFWWSLAKNSTLSLFHLYNRSGMRCLPTLCVFPSRPSFVHVFPTLFFFCGWRPVFIPCISVELRLPEIQFVNSECEVLGRSILPPFCLLISFLFFFPPFFWLLFSSRYISFFSPLGVLVVFCFSPG